MKRSPLLLWLSVPLAAVAGFVSRPVPGKQRAEAEEHRTGIPARGVAGGQKAREDLSARAAQIFEQCTGNPATADLDSAAVQGLLRDWVAVDSDAVVKWALTFPEPLRERVVHSALMEIARQKPESITELLHLVADERSGVIITSNGGGYIVAEALRTMLARDPASGLAWLRGEWSALCKNNAQGDDVIIEELAGRISEGRFSLQEAWSAMPAGSPWMLQRLWPHLPVPQLAEAAVWLRDSGDKNLHKLLPALVDEWAAADGDAAADFVQAVSQPEIREALMDSPLESIRREGLFTPAEKARILARRLQSSTPGDWDDVGGVPGRDYAQMLDGLPASPDTEKASAKIAQLWGAMDPHRAVEWAAALPDPTQRSAAMMATVQSWATEDAWGASEWLVQQPDGAMRDTAAAALAASLAAEEPDSAWHWAGDIAVPAVRLQAMATVLNQWTKTDPAGAAAAAAALSRGDQAALNAASPDSSTTPLRK